MPGSGRLLSTGSFQRAALRCLRVLACAWMASCAETTTVDSARPVADRSPASTGADVREVTARGWGASPKDARLDCLRAAVHQAAGLLVVTADEVRNDAVIESIIASRSDGFIDLAHEIGDPEERRPGLWLVQCRYRVRTAALRDAIAAAQASGRGPDIDLTQSETQQTWDEGQEKDAVQIVRTVFRDYPRNVLRVEMCGPPVRRASSEDRSIVEVSLRVSVDPARWNAWRARAIRLLGPVAEAKDAQPWTLRQTGAIQMARDAAEPVDRQSGWYTDEARAIEFRRIREMESLLPEAERGEALMYIRESPGKYQERSLSQPPCLSQARVLAIFDPESSVVHWWRLPPQAWEEVRRALEREPRLDVRLVDGDGRSIGEPVYDWWRDGVGPYVHQRVGHPELRAQLGSDANVRCRVAWSLSPRVGPPGASHLIIPYATLELACSKGTAFGFAPASLFPFQFRVDRAQLANLRTRAHAEWNWSTP